MFRLSMLRLSLIALASATINNGFANSCQAGGIEPIQRVGRVLGVGWGDGYHSCKDSGCRPGANLPPRSYHKQFNHQSSFGSGIANFYNQFDSGTRCGCQGAGCQLCCLAGQHQHHQAQRSSLGNYYSSRATQAAQTPWRSNGCDDSGCDSIEDQLEQSASPQPAAPETEPEPNPSSPSDERARLMSPGVVKPQTTEVPSTGMLRLTAELAESQKRPIRPLPPQTKREIKIPDPLSSLDIRRPIRPLPPLTKRSEPLFLPAIDADAENKLNPSAPASPSEEQIVSKAINDVVISEFGPPIQVNELVKEESNDKPVTNPSLSAADAKPATTPGNTTARPALEMVPQVAKVPDWMVVRQPR